MSRSTSSKSGIGVALCAMARSMYAQSAALTIRIKALLRTLRLTRDFADAGHCARGRHAAPLAEWSGGELAAELVEALRPVVRAGLLADLARVGVAPGVQTRACGTARVRAHGGPIAAQKGRSGTEARQQRARRSQWPLCAREGWGMPLRLHPRAPAVLCGWVRSQVLKCTTRHQATLNSFIGDVVGGASMIAAKADVAHGEWLPMLGEAELSERDAQRLMKVARNPGLSNPTNFSDLSGKVAVLLELSRLDTADIERRIETGAVTPKTKIREARNYVTQVEETRKGEKEKPVCAACS